ncbi:MAG: hypothetical protein RLZZ67_115 [Candidatus Parcubacteria bacterium]|jgi:hypothetical protein
MKKDTREQGFALKLMVIVVGVCIIFIVLAGLASRIGLGTGSLSPSILTNYNPSSDIESRTNPMLDFGNDSGFVSSDNSSARSVPNTDGTGKSPYYGKVNMSVGNSYTIQPSDEYLILTNNTAVPVNITGWAFLNSKGSRPIQNSGNSYFYPSPDTAIIGKGTEFLNSNGVFNTGPIMLKSGDTAYVVTGKNFAQFPFSIWTSFRENICLGYLENYPFTPRVNLACPALVNDPLVKTLTDECYDYVATLGRCENPEKNNRKVYDQQPSHCKNFIAARVGYAQCVAQNSNVNGFSLNQWRIFLGQSKEMWALQRETITLYDAKGLIVSQLSY